MCELRNWVKKAEEGHGVRVEVVLVAQSLSLLLSQTHTHSV
jgi:hypothetical protein